MLMVTNMVMVATVGVVAGEVFLSEQSHLKEVELYRSVQFDSA